MRSLVLAVCLLAGACASGPREEPVSAAPVIAAERAFAARAREEGWVRAFRAYAAPDGLIMQPEPVGAQQSLAGTPDDGNRSLYWWPEFAGIARSGDLGFTTGPYVAGSDVVRGHYFTVWRRQPDGSWKWIYDGGPPVRDETPFARDGAPDTLPTVQRGLGSQLAALEAVAALEHHNADDAAIARLVASDARVNRPRLPPGIGAEGAAAAYARPAGTVRYSRVSAAASDAGDMVFTINESFWGGEDGARGGHAMRIWQLRPEGWRIVYDQLLPRPPPRPPAAQ